MRSAGAMLLLFVIVQVMAGSTPFTSADQASARRFLEVEFTNNAGAMVIGLLDRDGSKIFAKGGLDNGSGRQVDANTIFELGSITKVFTALLALEMEQQGELKLSDPVAKHLPAKTALPTFQGQPITIGNLARQDSGLPRFPNNVAPQPLSKYPRLEMKRLNDAYDLEDMFAYLARHQLTQRPGTGFVYSNTGMALLGHTLAQRLGIPYEAAVRRRITTPLGMADTGIELTKEQRSRLASGHFADGSKAENVQFQAMAPAGSILSTPKDMLRFLAAILGFHESELKPLFVEMAAIKHKGSPRFGNTGTPWMDEQMYQPPGSKLLGHGGGGFGYLAFVGFDTLKRRGVVVLSSQMNWSPERIGWTLLQGFPLTRQNVTLGVKEVIGLGVALRPHEASGLLQFARVFPRSPAGQAGLARGQLLHSVNGADIQGKALRDCLALLGGPEGSRFQIEISEADGSNRTKLSLIRRKFITAD